MRQAITRHLLERIYEFARPTVSRDGLVTYECAYCGGQDDHEIIPHPADCPYWAALPSFATPAAERLVSQAFPHG